LAPMAEDAKWKDRAAPAPSPFGAPPPGQEDEIEEEIDPKKPKDKKKDEKKGKEKVDDKKKNFHESHNAIRLAESKAKNEIRNAKARVLKVIQKNLETISQGLAKDIIKNYKDLPESRKIDALSGVSSKGLAAYTEELKIALADQTMISLKSASKEVPAAVRKFFSQDGSFKLSEWDALPPNIRKQLNLQSRLLVQTTTADLEKVTFMQFGDSVLSTDSPLIIEDDILQAGETFTNGAQVQTAAGNSAARLVNNARTAVFFDTEVLEEIESFTFINGDPTAEICIELAGRTFRKDDPEAARYFPPLHHNCESYISVNLVGKKNNPAIDPEGLRTDLIPGL
jgi:hypothetical protein